MGVDSETDFWERMLAGEYPQFQEEFNSRFDPTIEVRGLHVAILDELSMHTPIQDIKILDVGSGLVTSIGKVYEGVHLNITAVDERAEYYDRLLHRYKKEPPIRTLYCDGQKLTQQFSENSFYYIHIQNVLDHMVSPLDCINGMVFLLKSGGFITMAHQIYEGRMQNYEGLHQFDCFEQDTDMYIKGKNIEINVSETLRSPKSFEYIRVNTYENCIELVAKTML